MCVVTEAVRRNYMTAKASVAEIEGQVKEWLKFAKSREKSHRLSQQRRDSRDRASAPLPEDPTAGTDSEPEVSD